MVSPDTQAVTITCYDPHTQFGARGFQSGCDRCCTTVNGVQSICVHVIGEPAAATDAGNDHNVLAGDAKCWHYFLHLCQDGIITAARAPAHFLVCRKILRRKGRLWQCSRFTHTANLVDLNGSWW